jgi:hypothetical protein
MDAPSAPNTRLVQMAGGSRIYDEREVARLLWKSSCIELLSKVDRKKLGRTTEAYAAIEANTEEVEDLHRRRMRQIGERNGGRWGWMRGCTSWRWMRRTAR